MAKSTLADSHYRCGDRASCREEAKHLRTTKAEEAEDKDAADAKDEKQWYNPRRQRLTLMGDSFSKDRMREKTCRSFWSKQEEKYSKTKKDDKKAEDKKKEEDE